MEDLHKPVYEAHLPLTINDEEHDLTFDNTTVYEFGHGYDKMNHVYISLGERALALYHHDELIETLNEHQYPRVFQPQPNAQEVETYVQFQIGTLDNELAGDDTTEEQL